MSFKSKMLLGKRQRRPEMRRTLSITEFIPEVGVLQTTCANLKDEKIVITDESEGGQDWLSSRHVTNLSTMRGQNRRNSADFVVVDTAPFLKNCGLCRRRLGPGKDIFMYRGEMAFCSLECREQQMKHDERKEKWSLASMKRNIINPSSLITKIFEPSS
ncbi:Zf-FLZ domain-containing protein [Dioscorea alata]|uniref:Zf-FLZ domain-containing protein n=2 Tax=Dioscorea alata TaxID=55571 RepID=A0ACB7TXE4_DIOAL|nr:Zf-FLZ domain-containing protein [Dioscorea alata]KAH7652719.1 Zf-FLZ domain-containing protein [Dioscorea alata]